MNHVKIFKAGPREMPHQTLVQLWYKTFPTDHDGRLEMKTPTRLANKTSTAWSCAEDQILENKISGNGFQKIVLHDKQNEFLKSIYH